MNLQERLIARYHNDGPLAVSTFMQMALFDPEGGYYARGPTIGRSGDFYTASNTSLFAAALATFVADARKQLGPDARVVELGGGSGALAEALGPHVLVVEPNAGLADQQRARGLAVVADVRELPPDIPLVVIANEVLDVLPVDRAVRTPEGWRELRVAPDATGAWYETAQEAPPAPPLLAELAHLEASAPVGMRVEIATGLASFLAPLAQRTRPVIALFIDYGGASADLYGEGAPVQGTLRGYHDHKVVKPFERPGQQDITADVDFTRLARVAALQGWRVHGPRPQGNFLAECGLVDAMMASQQKGEMAAYLSAKNLLMPTGMGTRFQAVCLTNAVAEANEAPLGFRQPTWR